MIKIINVVEDDELAYVATLKKKTLKFKRSGSRLWTDDSRNEKIATLKDIGDDSIIKIADQKIKLNANELVELYLLIKIKLESYNEFIEYKFLEE
jgi:hypothetical protein